MIMPSNKDFLIYTCCDEKYCQFIPIFILSHCRCNDGCAVEVKTSMKKPTKYLENTINILKDYFSNCEINVEFDAFKEENGKSIYRGEKILTNTVRFLLEPKMRRKYVYITDIDIINTEPILIKHIENMAKLNLDYSNMVRQGTIRLTGLHFILWDKYYPINTDNINLTMNDEMVLHEIVKKKNRIDYNTTYRPVHGIHVSMNRQPFDEIGWGISENKKEGWKKIESCPWFNRCFDSEYMKNVKNIICEFYNK